ncbi:MAG: HAMP domain-containing histidine kinase [Ignavibacteriales bacterium]|nr:HAMP domain-containing histidine kinase [Ignavibacteriales bacterium]
MKLINKISRYFLFVSILVFIVVSVGLYFVIENTITEETDEQLSNISQKAVQELKNGRAVSFSPFVEIIPVNHANDKNEFNDVLIKSNEEDDGEPFRQLTSFTNVNGKFYKVIVRISLIEKEDMLSSILTVVLISFLLFVFVLYFVNNKVSKNILKDFYDTLKKLEGFSIKSDEELLLSNTNIEEFNQLNKSVLFLSQRAKNEYRSLKEFSEDMNHEIQTPLAIAKSKLEILLQDEELNENDLNQVNAVLTNLNRLERVNKSILLLNKLEHKNLFENAPIIIEDEIKSILSTFSDFIKTKNLIVETEFEDKTSINANQSLINILFTNLISNAIKHNNQNGKIIVELKNKLFSIKNSGVPLQENPSIMFNRFVKSTNSVDSVGLGLTIVKRICDLYSFKIQYETQNEWHEIKLYF